MLSIKNLGKSYRRKAVLQGLTHDFQTGVTIIAGRSGAGKSTLLRLCATAEKPSHGDILWQGNNLVKTPRPFRAVLGYAPQAIDFPEDISATEFLLHIAALKSIRRAQAYEQAMGLLNALGLGQDAQGRIQTYSGGMRRRLGLAQAFLGAPQCLILDEPTAELDPLTAQVVTDLIQEKAKSAVILMTTHNEADFKTRTHQRFIINALADKTDAAV